MAEQFARSVEHGLRLAKRIYYGKDHPAPTAPPPKAAAMERSISSSKDDAAAAAYLPAAPMVYAAISDPSTVDNPDILSYQPYVHGMCDPPALIPLQMHAIAMEIECCLDTAFVALSGTWRVHCVTATKSCDCRVAVPMGDQGSILGVEIDVSGKSYFTRLMTMGESTHDDEKPAKPERGFLMPHIYTLRVPQVYGGSILSLKVKWSQRLSYQDGQFCLSIPFSFPAYVFPVGKKISRERIELNVDSGIGTELLCKTTSHPLKELRRQVGKLGLLYEAQTRTWSDADFKFSYTVYSRDISGELLFQSPSLHDFDQREMFCLYLFPPNSQCMKIFKKEVVFVVDISGSMRGMALENVKTSVLVALSRLDPEDYFNVIAFNGETHSFSSSMERSTREAIEAVAQWIDLHFIAEGSTNILSPLNQAMEMLSKNKGSIPLIFLVTDGAVEDERYICNVIKGCLMDQGSMCPRISTLGIGSYCNHYFLQMLAQIGRGYYDVAYNIEAIEHRLERLISNASSIILANITIDSFDHLDDFELYPSQIPDLVSGCPLVVSGRYNGKFPDSVKAEGILADRRSCILDLKLRKVKDIPLDKVFASRQIEILTAQAWLFEDNKIEEKVAQLSIGTGFSSEYTGMILLQKWDPEPIVHERGIPLWKKLHWKTDVEKMDSNGNRIVFLQNLGIGFGNTVATAQNLPAGIVEALSQKADGFVWKMASKCCGRLADQCCCMCFLNACMKMNDQCVIVFTQLCSALSCFECISCCIDLCSGD